MFLGELEGIPRSGAWEITTPCPLTPPIIGSDGRGTAGRPPSPLSISLGGWLAPSCRARGRTNGSTPQKMFLERNKATDLVENKEARWRNRGNKATDLSTDNPKRKLGERLGHTARGGKATHKATMCREISR